jgi:hypothetical protein
MTTLAYVLRFIAALYDVQSSFVGGDRHRSGWVISAFVDGN